MQKIGLGLVLGFLALAAIACTAETGDEREAAKSQSGVAVEKGLKTEDLDKPPSGTTGGTNGGGSGFVGSDAGNP